MTEIMRTATREKTYDYEFERGSKAAQLALDLGRASMLFASVERIPRYADGRRENDAEHSFMLGLVAPEIAQALELPLDIGLVSQFATVHDLIELQTGDIPTFLFNADEQSGKEQLEHQALHDLIAILPAHTGTLLARYESQQEPEARFVRYIDKLLPLVIDIVGAGERVMGEDYGITSEEAVRQSHSKLHERIVTLFGHEFPELDLAHKLLCELFEHQLIHRLD